MTVLKVTFAVKELRRLVGSLNTMVGNQEGSVMAGVKFPNIGGRGERFQVNFSVILITCPGYYLVCWGPAL